MNRRSFLATIAASIAGALPVISLAASSNSGQKYIDALALFDRAVAVSQDRDLINPAIDSLLQFLFANFQQPGRIEDNIELANYIQDAIDNSKLEDIRHVPSRILETAWPILAMKFLIKDHRALIDYSKLHTFRQFADTHSSYIFYDRKST